ncbi:hypothetical protein BZG36_04008 [Bifiguratus adelaidae]|uniref:(d)CMP kinase n=1 Tax=Bifiguratus adelaidae TaxID=1938954 RepID=A0A261XYE5_9FUNG|nr:hypothetical protein BZG36_04008 [Bifiguratus adelaidae]
MFKCAIDGGAASGKSSTARHVARRLGFGYIDTGSMFRAVTLQVLRQQVDPKDKDKVMRIAQATRLFYPSMDRVALNGEDVTEAIRTPLVTRHTSSVASNPGVREVLARLQRQMANDTKQQFFKAEGYKRGFHFMPGVVMDGRDIGTVILPDADLKVFMVADAWVRAERRYKEHPQGSVQEIYEALLERDKADTQREIAPLTKAPDAIQLDTSRMQFEDQVKTIEDLIIERIEKRWKADDESRLFI